MVLSLLWFSCGVGVESKSIFVSISLRTCFVFFLSLREQVSAAKAAGSGAAMPRSERLCKVLPKVMEAAIRGVQDLDEQVRPESTAQLFVPLKRCCGVRSHTWRRLCFCDDGQDFRVVLTVANGRR